jgi:hypothetical protein
MAIFHSLMAVAAVELTLTLACFSVIETTYTITKQINDLDCMWIVVIMA